MEGLIMKHPVILDACSIINLLRIDDEEDESLLKYIISLDLHIAETVHNEVKRNYKRNKIAQEKEEYIDRSIVKLQQHLFATNGFHMDSEIIKDLSRSLYDELTTYTNYKKRQNGELLSTALAVCLSREKSSMVYFYTDDKPATDDFLPYFHFQQAGTIQDTVDLLIFLHWSNADFKLSDLKRYLSLLWEDFNQPLKIMIKEIAEVKNNLTHAEYKDVCLRKNIDDIIEGFYELDLVKISNAIAKIKENPKASRIAKKVDKFPNIEHECHLVSKIRDTRSFIDKYEILKI